MQARISNGSVTSHMHLPDTKRLQSAARSRWQWRLARVKPVREATGNNHESPQRSHATTSSTDNATEETNLVCGRFGFVRVGNFVMERLVLGVHADVRHTRDRVRVRVQLTRVV